MKEQLQRFYQNQLKLLIHPGKVLVIYGPRQVGKTTLVKTFLKDYQGKVFRGSGDNRQLQIILESQDFSKIVPYFQDYDLVFIDEAQQISQVGQSLKILVDQLPHLKLVATGSSSFDLSNQLGEPLVGRQKIIQLFPLSAWELKQNFTRSYLEDNLENLLLYGSYPEVVTAGSYQAKKEYLQQLRDAYLLKDIFELQNIKNSKKILDLLRLLAFQIGQEVSIQELGCQLSLSKNTVEHYLDLLEKNFVLINIRGFARNLRKEINKTSRYYFYDNGVRNAILGNFSQLEERDDRGQLWENYLFIERLKRNAYLGQSCQYYFWRTYDRQEIDLIEESDGRLSAFEFKWSKQAKAPSAWVKTYPEATFEVINRQNFLEFLVPPPRIELGFKV